MADFSVVFDPMLDKERAEFDNGSGGSGGSSYVGGERINIAGGTISFVNSADIVNVTGTSVTLQPNTAYKIYATSQAITLNANPPAAGKWAYEGHLEIFTAGTGYVVTGTNVVLANALEPDSVNNCTVRFHDGIAIIAVEDHVAGYIVVNGVTSGTGSLYYGITTSTNDYVAFDASLNGTTIPLAGAVSEGEKHVVGNGYTETAITGAVNCGTSKFTVANLALSDVQITGGTMTLGDVYIPSGSTVAVSGGGLAVEKVTGNGGVIDLGGTHVAVPYGNSINAASVTLTSGGADNVNGGGIANAGGGGVATITNVSFIGNNGSYGGGLGNLYNNASANVSGGVFSGCNAVRGGGMGNVTANANVSGCTFSGCNATQYGGGVYCGSGTMNLTECTITGNYASLYGGGLTLDYNTSVTLSNCVISGNNAQYGGKNCYLASSAARLTLAGSNVVGDCSGSGTVTISSGAVLDLTGNTNAEPINPGGGITFEQGGATVYPSAGQASAYMLGGMTVPQIGNTNVVNLNSQNVIISSGSAYASGCTFTGGSATLYGGAFYVLSGTLDLSSCTVTENKSNDYGVGIYLYGANANLVDCIVSGNSITSYIDDLDVRDGATAKIVGGTYGVMALFDSSTLSFDGTVKVDALIGRMSGSGTVTISSGASINLTSGINPGVTGGITVLTGGCTVNGNAIPAGTYTSIDSTGTPT